MRAVCSAKDKSCPGTVETQPALGSIEYARALWGERPDLSGHPVVSSRGGIMRAEPDRTVQRPRALSARGPMTLALLGAAALVVLSVLVATRTTQDIDVAVRDLLRPDDEWGEVQMRVDVVVEGLKPRNIAVLLALIGLVASLVHSSWRPALYTALVAGLAGALTLLIKLALERTDPHHDMTAVGGSFPSGHTMSVLVCFGLVVLLVRDRSRWWEWAFVALVGLAMGLSLLIQAAHWFTDVVGGFLVALTVMAAASTLRLREPRRR